MPAGRPRYWKPTPRFDCEMATCSNQAFVKVVGRWMCDDCRLKRILDYTEATR